MDLLILSGCTRVRTPAALNHAVYAARHGHRYVFDVTPRPVNPVFIHKVDAVRRHLGTADWLFWIDDDAFFTRLDQPLASFLEGLDPTVELVFCASPVNPRGGWTWMSAGQLLVRNTPAMADYLDAVLRTDLAAVRSWWRPDELGMFTNGDQDAFVYQLLHDGSPWGDRYLRLPWEAFNSRPYHYASSLDEHFICHFAVPGGRPKMDEVRDFAARLGTTTALLPAEALEPYATFIRYSETAALLAPPAEGGGPGSPGSRPGGPPGGRPATPAGRTATPPVAAPAPRPKAGPLRRLARRVRRRLTPRT